MDAFEVVVGFGLSNEFRRIPAPDRSRVGCARPRIGQLNLRLRRLFSRALGSEEPSLQN